MNLEKILTDVCAYAFLELKCSINIRILKIEISLKLSHLVQSARPCAAGADEGIIEVLVTTNNFLPVFNSIRSLDHFQLPMGYSQYLNNDYLSLILLIQKNNDETVILKFYLFQTRVR
ncbi:unnamed protein product [Rotaria magnacalcarata]|nr:unnamed protein product [Rotaria magnacalcarata]